MNMEVRLGNTLLASDHRLVDHIVGEVKSQGIFDQFRKECIADVDTKPAYQNLRTRVEGSVNSFLAKQTWKPDLNKNQLRETLRKHIHDAPYLDAGVERIVDQVVNPKVYSVFMPQIEDVVYKFLGIERPKVRERNGPCGLKDLLPKDLDPVSPESDRNSLKDISLESMDANIHEVSVKDEKELKSNSCTEQKLQSTDNNNEKIKDESSESRQFNNEEKQLESIHKISNKTASNSNVNSTLKLDDKMEEEEEDSPTFEPIDIMNLNESNISNDSQLSGISELTSHRSRSPDFSNDLSRDNLDFSNQDSQFSKVSSDSRLSIVTDFGSSNHALTPLPETWKEDSNKDKSKDCSDFKYVKDNFKAIREIELSKSKDAKAVLESDKCKDNTQQIKESKDSKNIKSNLTSKESLKDFTDNEIKDKNEFKDYKDKSKDSDSSKSKYTKEKMDAKESRKDKDKDYNKKKQNSHSNLKNDKYSKDKTKEKPEQSREISEKHRDNTERLKDNFNKAKEDKPKDIDKKDNVGKEAKDLKDIYKEKIRELREKKELTEKEKLSKDIKGAKSSKESKDRKDSSRDRKDHKKNHKNSSSRNSNSTSSRHDKSNKGEEKSILKSDSKSSVRSTESKDLKFETKDKGRRDDKRSKDSKSKNHSVAKSDFAEKAEKLEIKKMSKNEREDKIEKSDTKKDSKIDSQKASNKKDVEKNEKLDNKKETKIETQVKDKKQRREDKKSKVKDDHSSLRKNSSDRRSTDRDGSNGSNGKSSQKSGSSSGTSTGKAVSSSLCKESNSTSNYSSETSDSIEESQSDELKVAAPTELINKNTAQPIVAEMKRDDIVLKTVSETEACGNNELSPKKIDLGSVEFSLPLKKRPLFGECNTCDMSEIKIKKPKFAKNIHEAKKLMKIRKRMEKQKMQQYKSAAEIKVQPKIENEVQPSASKDTDDLIAVPDEERVQIIEIPDDEYEQPYPEKQTNLSLDERSRIILDEELSIHSDEWLQKCSNGRSKLSEMEQSIRQSLNEMISDKRLMESSFVQNTEDCLNRETNAQSKTKLTETCSQAKERSSIITDKEQSVQIVDTQINLNENSVQHEYLTSTVNSSVFPNAETKQVVSKIKEGECISEDNEDNVTEEITLQNANVCEQQKTQILQNDTLERERQENKSDCTEKLEVTNKGAIGTTAIAIETNCSESVNDIKIERDSMSELCEKTKQHVNDAEPLERIETKTVEESKTIAEIPMVPIEDQEDCLYFKEDNEMSSRFAKFLESLELEEGKSLEQIIESLGGQLVSSLPKTMAPPLPKRKRASSPLTDILLNNSNNNNDGHKMIVSLPDDDGSKIIKKRKLGRPKKQRPNASLCTPQALLNGENFVMPLSPESDVSATSEKIPSHHIKEEKSRQRGSQRYSSDDLYKPRPFFSSSSRRYRRSTQA